MPNIILIGFMGCGKSTLGKKIAKNLNYKFIDSDSEIERITEKSIKDIFEEKGEIYFRELESAFLYSLPKNENFVLSSGGGLPCSKENIEKLKKIGVVLYLKLSPFEISKRLISSKKVRPLIDNLNEEELYYYIKDKLNERKVFYEQAHFILKHKKHNFKDIIEIINSNKN